MLESWGADLVRGRIANVIRLKESALTLAAVEHDELTGLYTEQAFMHYAKMLMKLKADTPMNLVIVKILDFKMVKNIYGVKKAEEAYCYLASAYRRVTKHGLIGKKGNSSFVCLYWGDNHAHTQRFEDALRGVVDGAPIKGMKVKYGVYEDIDKSLPVSAIMDNYSCDLAYYTEEMARKRMFNQMIENCFEGALEKQEFVVYYQPKVDLATEKVIGAEERYTASLPFWERKAPWPWPPLK